MRRSLVIASVIASLATGCVFVPLEDVILRPELELRETPAGLGFQYEEARVHVARQRQVVIWHIPSAESKALVVVVPGSDRNKSRYVEALPVFIPNGYDVILMDYEGFGDSPGRASLENVIGDVFAVADYAATRHEKVVLFGASLGTPAAVFVATHREFAACVFEGSLIMEREAELWLHDVGLCPWLARVLGAMANLYILPQLPEEYDILRYVALVEEPKLFIHSGDDNVTPFSGGVMVFEAAAEPKEFWQMHGRHGRMIRLEPQKYMQKVISWLDGVLHANDRGNTANGHPGQV